MSIRCPRSPPRSGTLSSWAASPHQSPFKLLDRFSPQAVSRYGEKRRAPRCGGGERRHHERAAVGFCGLQLPLTLPPVGHCNRTAVAAIFRKRVPLRLPPPTGSIDISVSLWESIPGATLPNHLPIRTKLHALVHVVKHTLGQVRNVGRIPPRAQLWVTIYLTNQCGASTLRLGCDCGGR